MRSVRILAAWVVASGLLHSAIVSVVAAAALDRTTLTFRADAFANAGLSLEIWPDADPDREEGAGFLAQVRGQSRTGVDDLQRLGSAELFHSGRLAIRNGRWTREIDGFVIRGLPDGRSLELVGIEGARLFELRSGHARIRAGRLEVRHMDVMLSAELAEDLRIPRFAGRYLGVADFDIELPAPEAGNRVVALGGCVADFDPELDLDVELTEIDGVESMGREGTRIALAPSAMLRNSGERDVAWFRSIAPDGEVGPHPYLSMHLYRLHQGLLLQLGQSDVKHAFFAVNSGCPCSGAQVLFAGCGDTYGVSTNEDPSYLAPRSEVNPFTGEWERVGSHFDGLPVDDMRDHDGYDHDFVEHRLSVEESELEVAGAEYFVEAWYVAAGDVDLPNSMGRVAVLPVLQRDTWFFPIAGATIHGSVLDTVVDEMMPAPGTSSEWLDTGEGRLQVATRVQDLGGGLHGYEMSLMNFDFAREIEGFSVPIPAGGVPQSMGFSPSGDRPSWEIEVSAERIRWSAPPGEALAWGSLASFRFVLDVPPIASRLALVPGGGGGHLEIGSLAPALLPEPGPWLAALAALAALGALRKA